MDSSPKSKRGFREPVQYPFHKMDNDRLKNFCKPRQNHQNSVESQNGKWWQFNGKSPLLLFDLRNDLGLLLPVSQ
jgi:hypothetical protein